MFCGEVTSKGCTADRAAHCNRCAVMLPIAKCSSLGLDCACTTTCRHKPSAACAKCVAMDGMDVGECASFGLDCKCVTATMQRKAQAGVAVTVSVAVNIEDGTSAIVVFEALLRCLQSGKTSAMCIDQNKQAGH